MTEYADLEIGLHHRDASSYTVEMRASQPGNEGDVRSQGLARFDLQSLRELAAQPEAYGRALYTSLFEDSNVLTGFLKAWAVAQASETPLRLRLMVGATAPELNDLRWETLRDSGSGQPLCTGDRLAFSRYLSSPDWRRVRLRPQGALRALALVANPSDLASYDLLPIEAEGEVARLRAGLGEISLTVLPDQAANQRATLSNLAARLRADNYDIVYLVCHGAMVKGEPWLWLEDNQGKVALTAGGELVTRLREMPQCPRLVILASCQSAGTGLGEALAALGPRLVEAGVPAVIAMQGKVGLETIARFMPVFFAELRQSGNIDQAMAAARGAVRDLPDYWMPALFMRLKSGRIWYVPGFSDNTEEFEKWQSLAGFIREGTCTPILGSGLLEPYFGTAQELAHHWADQYGYPLEASDQEDLARVAQYVVTRYDQAYLRLTLRQTLGAELMRRFGADLPAQLVTPATWTAAKLLQTLNTIGGLRRKQVPYEVHRTLAEMRLPLYLTANPDDLLAEALREAGADPQVRLCPWNRLIARPKCQYDETPTPERPLVYHLFGHLSEPYSIVLTEDEYFDYLIGVTTNKDLIPDAVRAALTGTALLFVGFQIDDWDFRILFRSLMAQEGSELGKLLYSHVAAQVEPEEGRLLDPRRARRYLEKYFESEKINLYWGGTEEFMRALAEHLNEKAPAHV
jgi:hypothetical protein